MNCLKTLEMCTQLAEGLKEELYFGNSKKNCYSMIN